MKLSRTTLIDRATTELLRRRDAQDQWDLDVDNAEEEARLLWFQNNIEQWREYRDAITKALRSGKPIRSSDLPAQPKEFSFKRGYWSKVYRNSKQVEWVGYNVDHDFGKRPLIREAEIEGLLSFLEAITDDEVTLDSLVRAGFKTGLQRIFAIPAK